jgi:predicted nucleic acid-binding Zn ribbon protein
MNQAVAVKKYPTQLYVRCGSCGHQGAVSTHINTSPKLKCSKCGARNAIVGGRVFCAVGRTADAADRNRRNEQPMVDGDS